MSHYWFFPSFTIKGPADGADVSDNAHMCTPASVYRAPAMCQALCTMTSPVLPSHLSSAVVNSLEMRKPVQRDHSFVSFHSLHRRSRNLNQSLCKSKARAVSITQHGWWAVGEITIYSSFPGGSKVTLLTACTAVCPVSKCDSKSPIP